MKGGIEGRNRTVAAAGREGGKEVSGEDDRQQPDHGERGSVLPHLISHRMGVCYSICLFSILNQHGLSKKQHKADILLTKSARLLRLVQDDSIVRLLEPLHGLLASHLVRIADVAALSLALAHTATRTSQLHVEIHTENTGVGIVLDTQIDVLLNTKTEVSGVGEVSLHQLVLLHLQTTLKDLQSLLTTNGGMHGDLLVTTDGEGTNGETGWNVSTSHSKLPTLSVNGLLTRNLLEDTSSLGDSISRLTNANVDDELLNSDVSHHVRLFTLKSS